MNNREMVLNYFGQRDRGWILTLIATVCLVYLPFLGNPFVFDDLSFFNGTLLYGTAVKYFVDAPFQWGLRWLPYASLARTWEWVGDAPHLYRLVNALLHASNVILLFFLLRQLLSAVMPNFDRSSVTRGSSIGALVFACHPVAVYAVGYVVQRSILLATLFAIVMQLAYVRGLISGQKRWLVLAVLAYALAGFSKEHSVMMPAVLLAMTILLWDKKQLGKQMLWLTFAAFAMVGIMLLLISKGLLNTHVLGPISEPMGDNTARQLQLDASASQLQLLSVLTQAGLFFKYFLLWLLPNPAWMSVDMREPFVPSLAAWQGWLGAAAFIAYGLLAFRQLLKRRGAGLVGLALLSPWLLFIVEFSSMRMQEIFVLYRSYLWMPALMLLVALLLVKLPGRRTFLGLLCVVILLVPLAWNRLWVFGDNYRLWNDAALLLRNDQVAGADRIFYNRGLAELAARKWEEAVEDMQRVVALSPQLVQASYSLGVAYVNSGRYQEAVTQFDAVIAQQPDDDRAYYGKGLSLKRLHKDVEAIQQMQKACELKNMMACMIVAGVRKK